MRPSFARPWLAWLLLVAVFSSSPFGSMEQPSSAVDGIAVSAVLDGLALTPSPGARSHDLDRQPFATAGIAVVAPSSCTSLARPAPSGRTPPPPPAPPHLSYDALAPPRT